MTPNKKTSRIITVVAAVLCLAQPPTFAIQYFSWTGTAGSDWNNTANWIIGTNIPPAGDLVPATMIPSGTDNVYIDDIYYGSGATPILTSGSIAVRLASIGRNGRGEMLIGGSGILTETNSGVIGVEAGSFGKVTISDNGYWRVGEPNAANLVLAEKGSSGALLELRDSGSLTVTSGFDVGYSGTATLNMSGNSRIEVGAAMFIGRAANSQGVATLADNAVLYIKDGLLTVSGNATSSGTLILRNNAMLITDNDITVAQASKNAVILMSDNSSIYVTGSTGLFAIGRGGASSNATGTVALRDNAQLSVSGTFIAGMATSGNVDAGGNSTIVNNYGIIANSFKGYVTLRDNATWTSTTSLIVAASSGTAVLTLLDNALLTTPITQISVTNTRSYATINLYGGTLATGVIRKMIAKAALVDISGGAIVATENSDNFFDNLDSLTISGTGPDPTRPAFTFNTGTYTVTATNNIIVTNVGGEGEATRAFVKSGDGAFIITGSSDFGNGVVYINGGTLGITGTVSAAGIKNETTSASTLKAANAALIVTATNTTDYFAGLTSIEIDASVTPPETAAFTIDTAGNSITSDATVSSNAAAGSYGFEKTGDGILTLAAAANIITGTTRVLAGGLIANNALLDNVLVADGQTFGGSGTVANLALGAGSILQVGFPDSASALNIPGVLDLGTNATLKYSILDNGESSSLNAGTLALAGAPAEYTLNVNDWLAGTYNLGNITALSGASVILNGKDLDIRKTYSFSTASGSLELTIDRITNRQLVWVGVGPDSEENGRWNMNAANWFDETEPGIPYIFASYDAVRFDDRVADPSARAIDLAATMRVSDMFVAGSGTYAFCGTGRIYADAAGAYNFAGATGKLTKTGQGTLTLANSGSNQFLGGIDVGSSAETGGLIEFDRATQIATGPAAAITFHNTGTLRSLAAATSTLDNDIVVADGVTASLDTGGADFALAGSLSALGASGTLEKIGTSTLYITGSSGNAHALTISAANGNVFIDGGYFAGAIETALNTIAGGSGYAGRITTGANATLQVGLPGITGTLNVGTLNLGANNTLNYSLGSENESSALTVGTLNLSGAPGDYTFNFNNWLSGTYNLGNITGLSGANITLDGYDLNARQNYSYNTAGGNLELVIAPIANVVMVWSGTSSSPEGNGNWNINHTNWFDPGDVSDRYAFAPYDAVIFDDRVASDTQRNINVATSVYAYGIEVTGTGAYRFLGNGSVNTDSSGAGAAITGVSGTGKLVKTGPGTLTFANTGGNFFDAGIEIGATGTGGGILAFDRADQLATSASAAIVFRSTGTLRALANIDTDTPLTANIALGNQVKATMDTSFWTLTFSGSLLPLGTSGTISKIGTGALRLTGTTVGATALTASIDEGQLFFDGGIFDGTIRLNALASLAGSGTAAIVHALDRSSIQAGPGLLTIGNLNLASGATLAGSGTLGGTAVLNGSVTANIASGNVLTLTGANTGAGSLIKTGEGNLVFSSAASLGYTGGTRIDSGFVMLRNISGEQASALTHTFTLNGGWLDLSDTTYESSGTSANNWLGLAISQETGATAGGVIGRNDQITIREGTFSRNLGIDTPEGLFVVIDAGDGVAILTGTNHYAGYTRIDSGTLRVTADAQLGKLELAREVILNGGALQISSSFNTARSLELRASGAVHIDANVDTSWASIKNTGGTTAVFTKTGSGTFTLAGGNDAPFVDIREGRYVAMNADGAGDGVVTVADNATIEFRDIQQGVCAANIGGQGTLSLTATGTHASVIGLSGTNTIPTINISGSIIVSANSTHALGNETTAISIAEGARLNLNAPQMALGLINFANNNGFLAFGNAPGFKQATIAGLTGSGTLSFNVDLAQRQSDYLTILSAPVGDYLILIERAGSEPLRLDLPIPFASMPDSEATFALVGDRIDVGVYAFSLQSEVTEGQRTLSLVGSNELSRIGSFIYTTAAAQSLTWYSELDSVQKRMGELHVNTAASGKLNSWMRGYFQNIEYNSQATGTPFDERLAGADIGFDAAFPNKRTNAVVSLGMFAGYGQTERSFDTITGDGISDSAYAGLYSTLVTQHGWYIDLALKANRFENAFEIHDTDYYGNRTRIEGSYCVYGFGLSVELGKRFSMGKGWFFEPRVQGARALITGIEYTTSNDVLVNLERGTATQALAGLRFGRTLNFGPARAFQFYINVFKAREWNQDGRLTANGFRFEPKIDGDRIGGGGGISWIPCQGTQIYLSFEYADADCYIKPMGLNFGFTQSW